MSDKKIDKRKSVSFRGHKLARSRVPGEIPLVELTKWYLVLRALDGDPIAKELLDVSGLQVHDLDGKQVYPPMEREGVRS